MNKKNSTITYNIYHHPAACTTTTIIGRPQNKNTSKKWRARSAELGPFHFHIPLFQKHIYKRTKSKKETKMKFATIIVAITVACAAARRPSEVWTAAQEDAGIVRNNYKVGSAPHEFMDSKDLPQEFTWCNKDGKLLHNVTQSAHPSVLR